MKRYFVLGSLLVLAFVAGRLSTQAPPNAVAQGGGDVPIGNGDVNADGEIDLSDAVYILQSLFMAGPEIVPIESTPCDSCCPPPSGGGLPATGQTKCYDDAYPANEIPCDSIDYPGQDGFYQTGCPIEGRFVDNEDGTVTDACTGLMWQKDTADVSGNGSIGDEDRLNWQAALQHCEGMDFAGHDDWRLPNVRELQSIADYGRLDPPIDPVFEALSAWYGSSTSTSSDPGYAWIVSFYDGRSSYDEDIVPFVRAVRGGL